MSTLDCPKCIGKLQKISITLNRAHTAKGLQGAGMALNLEVDQCFVCKGIWFEKGELERYVSEGMTSLDSPSLDMDQILDSKKANCPNCRIPMTGGYTPSSFRVHVDICEKCGGIWTDSSEIDRIEKANKAKKESGGVWGILLSGLGLKKKEGRTSAEDED